MQNARGGCDRETDTRRDARRVELPAEASTSIPGWELAGILASGCGRLWKASSQAPEGPQRIAGCISARAEAGWRGFLRLSSQCPRVVSTTSLGGGAVSENPPRLYFTVQHVWHSVDAVSFPAKDGPTATLLIGSGHQTLKGTPKGKGIKKRRPQKNKTHQSESSNKAVDYLYPQLMFKTAIIIRLEATTKQT